MDLGLGNYNDVKTFVLPQAMWGADVDAQYGPVLQGIARGIAGRFDLYCNRKLARAVADVCRFPANRSHYYLPRYPFETISSLTLRATAADPWTDVSSAIVQQDELIGLIDFYVILADEMSLLQCTYTGGYFYETQEPKLADNVTSNPDFPTAMPEGATPLPDAIKQAWLSQIVHEFELKDRLLPAAVVGEGKDSKANWRLDQMQLLPEVQNTLAQYRRYQIV